MNPQIDIEEFVAKWIEWHTRAVYEHDKRKQNDLYLKSLAPAKLEPVNRRPKKAMGKARIGRGAGRKRFPADPPF